VFSLFVGQISGGLLAPPHMEGMIESSSQVPSLMLIYSLGFTALFGVFALLYRYAYSKRESWI